MNGGGKCLTHLGNHHDAKGKHQSCGRKTYSGRHGIVGCVVTIIAFGFSKMFGIFWCCLLVAMIGSIWNLGGGKKSTHHRPRAVSEPKRVNHQNPFFKNIAYMRYRILVPAGTENERRKNRDVLEADLTGDVRAVSYRQFR